MQDKDAIAGRQQREYTHPDRDQHKRHPLVRGLAHPLHLFERRPVSLQSRHPRSRSRSLRLRQTIIRSQYAGQRSMHLRRQAAKHALGQSRGRSQSGRQSPGGLIRAAAAGIVPPGPALLGFGRAEAAVQAGFVARIGRESVGPLLEVELRRNACPLVSSF